MSTGRESDKFMLRLPDGMRERIKWASEANGRSMNAEIVNCLEEAYPPVSGKPEMVELHRLLTKAITSEDSLTNTDQTRMEELLKLLGSK